MDPDSDRGPESRAQVSFGSLDEMIPAEHQVRFLDAFVDKLDLAKLQFNVKPLNKEGRPPFHPSLFLKIYLYGYHNGVRSSRGLEKECSRNIEMQWLCGKLVPSYHSIADFRKENPKALRNMFKLYVQFLQDLKLIGGKVVAIDGTKSRAHNSKKSNYSQSKINRHFDYIEKRTNEYLKEMDELDEQDDAIRIEELGSKLAHLKESKIRYEQLERQLQDSGDTQISTTDADSRALLVQGTVVEVSYNTQAAVDAKNKLVIATHTINRNDRNAMSAIALEAKQNIMADRFTVILDKGYHNGREIAKCQRNNINTIVAHSEIVNSNNFGTQPDYLVDKFIYNKRNDTYTCPAGAVLRTKGTWHTKKRHEEDISQYKKYRTPACKECMVRSLCTGRKDGGREIERSEYADAVDRNRKNYNNNSKLYRQRQEINEHIFGTIKRKWGYNYTNLIGLEKVNGEWSLIMLVYNMKRTMSLLTMPDLLKKLSAWKPNYKRLHRFFTKWLDLNEIWAMLIFEKHQQVQIFALAKTHLIQL
jgi:transposase